MWKAKAARPHYGIGHAYFQSDADAMKFVQHLIVQDVITENLLGRKAHFLKNREIRICLML